MSKEQEEQYVGTRKNCPDCENCLVQANDNPRITFSCIRKVVVDDGSTFYCDLKVLNTGKETSSWIKKFVFFDHEPDKLPAKFVITGTPACEAAAEYLKQR